MKDDRESHASRRRIWRAAALVIVLLALAGVAVVYALGMKTGRGVTPKLVNRATAAREVRELSAQPDKRFAPLPIEPEKREQ